jgi:hypothetical protein
MNLVHYMVAWRVRVSRLQVIAYDSLDALDEVALGELLEEAFGKKLPAGYFDAIRHKLLKVYTSATLRGAAIVTMENGEQSDCAASLEEPVDSPQPQRLLCSVFVKSQDSLTWTSSLCRR